VQGRFITKLADFGLSRKVQVKQQAIALRKTASGMCAQVSLPTPAKSRMTPSASLQRPQR
jgi:hypothetical protein